LDLDLDLDLRLGDLRLGDLRLGDLRLGDLRLGDLRLGDLRLGDLRLGDLDLLFFNNFLPIAPDLFTHLPEAGLQIWSVLHETFAHLPLGLFGGLFSNFIFGALCSIYFFGEGILFKAK